MSYGARGVGFTLDNNISEHALRVIALGRRNSLFVGPNENGKNPAILLSVVRTGNLLKVDAHDCLTDVSPRLTTIVAEHATPKPVTRRLQCTTTR